jgi:transcriptional regulator with XRE-family HTH domain
MSFGDRIKIARKRKKITQNRLAELTGISRSSIAQYENNLHEPDLEKISIIAKALDIPEQDLFDPSKKEEIAKQEIESHPEKYLGLMPKIQSMENMMPLPFITIGTNAEAIANIELIESIYLPKEIFPPHFDPKYIVVGKVLGDSMEPKYFENDIVFFDMVDGRNVLLHNGIYLVRYGDIVQIKTIQFLENGDIKVISFNDMYPPVQPVKDLGVDWEILGKPIMHWNLKIFSRLQLKEETVFGAEN